MASQQIEAQGLLSAPTGDKVFQSTGLQIRQLSNKRFSAWRRPPRSSWSPVPSTSPCGTFCDRQTAARALGITVAELKAYDEKSKQDSEVTSVADQVHEPTIAAAPSPSRAAAAATAADDPTSTVPQAINVCPAKRLHTAMHGNMEPPTSSPQTGGGSPYKRLKGNAGGQVHGIDAAQRAFVARLPAPPRPQQKKPPRRQDCNSMHQSTASMQAQQQHMHAQHMAMQMRMSVPGAEEGTQFNMGGNQNTFFHPNQSAAHLPANPSGSNMMGQHAQSMNEYGQPLDADYQQSHGYNTSPDYRAGLPAMQTAGLHVGNKNAPWEPAQGNMQVFGLLDPAGVDCQSLPRPAAQLHQPMHHQDREHHHSQPQPAEAAMEGQRLAFASYPRATPGTTAGTEMYSGEAGRPGSIRPRSNGFLSQQYKIQARTPPPLGGRQRVPPFAAAASNHAATARNTRLLSQGHSQQQQLEGHIPAGHGTIRHNSGVNGHRQSTSTGGGSGGCATGGESADQMSDGLDRLGLHGADPLQEHQAAVETGRLFRQRGGSTQSLGGSSQQHSGLGLTGTAAGPNGVEPDVSCDRRKTRTGSGAEPPPKDVLYASTTIGDTETHAMAPPRDVLIVSTTIGPSEEGHGPGSPEVVNMHAAASGPGEPAGARAAHTITPEPIPWRPTVPGQLAVKQHGANAMAVHSTHSNVFLQLDASQAPSATDVLYAIGAANKGLFLLPFRQTDGGTSCCNALTYMASWTALAAGGQGSVVHAELHSCNPVDISQPATLAMVATNSSHQGIIKVSLNTQFAWLDAKGVPRVVRERATEYDALLRAGQRGTSHSLRPCSVGAVLLPVTFLEGHVPAEVIATANKEEEESVAEALAVTNNTAVNPAGASELNLDRPDPSQRQMCLVLSYMELPMLDGCLWSTLKERPTGVSKEEALAVGFGCSQGLDDFGVAGLVHRDVKPQNLLQMRHAWALRSQHRFSKLPLFCNYYVISDPMPDLRGSVKQLTVRAGTPYYRAPEVEAQQPYTNKVDIWGFGLMMMQVRFGTQQVTNWKEHGLLHGAAGALQLENGRRPAAGSTAADDQHLLDEEEAEMLQGCLEPDPAKRWSLEQLMSCAYLARARGLVQLLKQPLHRDAWLRDWYRRSQYPHGIYPEGHGEAPALQP